MSLNIADSGAQEIGIYVLNTFISIIIKVIQAFLVLAAFGLMYMTFSF